MLKLDPELMEIQMGLSCTWWKLDVEWTMASHVLSTFLVTNWRVLSVRYERLIVSKNDLNLRNALYQLLP